MRLNEIDIHLTNRCNLLCKTCCYSSNELLLPELSTYKVKSVIDEAINLGCNDIHFSGGEPLLRYDIFELTEYVINRNVNLRIQTNGKLLTKANVKKLKRIGLKDLMISIDGHTIESCDFIRGKGSFEAAIEGIKNAISENFNIRVNTVLTEANKTLFIEIIKLAASLGVKKCSSFYFTPIGRGANNFNLWIKPKDYIATCDMINKDIDEFRKLEFDTDIIIEKAYSKWKDASSISIDGFTGCGGGCGHVLSNRDYLIIRCDGNVYPCILLVDTPFTLGNVKCTTLDNLWKYSKNWEILDRGIAVKQCGDCEHINLCNGGCAGYAHLLTGDYNNSDPRCVKMEIVPLCPIMKYNFRNNKLGGSSDDVLVD